MPTSETIQVGAILLSEMEVVREKDCVKRNKAGEPNGLSPSSQTTAMY